MIRPGRMLVWVGPGPLRTNTRQKLLKIIHRALRLEHR